jgi:hypothetical protein
MMQSRVRHFHVITVSIDPLPLGKWRVIVELPIIGHYSMPEAIGFVGSDLIALRWHTNGQVTQLLEPLRLGRETSLAVTDPLSQGRRARREFHPVTCPG